MCFFGERRPLGSLLSVHHGKPLVSPLVQSQIQMRLQAPFLYIIDHLVSKLLQRQSHIRHTLHDDF